jgi:hypothetical protein
MNNRSTNPSSSSASHALHLGALDIVLSAGLLVMPNVLIGYGLFQHARAEKILEYNASWTDSLGDVRSLLCVGAVNLALCLLFWLIRRYLVTPIYLIAKQLSVADVTGTSAKCTAPGLFHTRELASNVLRLIQTTHEYYGHYQSTQHALTQARQALSEINARQGRIMSSTCQEMLSQYQSVLAYANYLEEQVKQRSVDPDLRFDFDDVSESGFNLKLIAGALNVLSDIALPATTGLDISQLIQQSLITLSASLDRRSMRLSTAEVDLAVMARSEPIALTHALWMVLLGTIRYAAHESTLRLRCLYSHDQRHVFLSLVVNELSPGRLSEAERSAYMERQLHSFTPHMFAETIRTHGNLQLAELLLHRIEGSLSVLPLSSHSCEICLSLPAQPNTRQNAPFRD